MFRWHGVDSGSDSPEHANLKCAQGLRPVHVIRRLQVLVQVQVMATIRVIMIPGIGSATLAAGLACEVGKVAWFRPKSPNAH
jgi:hypothetical protein